VREETWLWLIRRLLERPWAGPSTAQVANKDNRIATTTTKPGHLFSVKVFTVWLVTIYQLRNHLQTEIFVNSC
jgi:hypothetical protein